MQPVTQYIDDPHVSIIFLQPDLIYISHFNLQDTQRRFVFEFRLLIVPPIKMFHVTSWGFQLHLKHIIARENNEIKWHDFFGEYDHKMYN